IIFILLFCGMIWSQSDTTAPIVYFISPGPNAFFSCDSGILVFKITDQSPIDWISSHLDMFVNESPPVVLAESLASPLDSFYYFILPFSLSDGDTVRLAYLPIYDIWGNWRNANFFFYVDLFPPEISLNSPGEGTLPDTQLIFSANLTDEMAGINIDFSYVFIEVYGTDNWENSFSLSSPLAYFSGETLIVDINPIGPISGGDTIDICIDAADNATGCGANRTDTCFSYNLPYTPPDIELIYPSPGAIVAGSCKDSVVFRITDTDSIIDIWISVGSDTYWITDDEIVMTGDSVIFYTSDIFDISTYYSIRLHCNDIYNNISEYTLGLWVDLLAPFIVTITPASSSLVTDTIITVDIQLVDYISGIDPTSLALTVDGMSTPFSFDSATGFLSFQKAYIGVTDTMSVVMNVCVNAKDNPDYCFNYMDSCFTLIYYIDIRGTEFFPPDGSLTACIDQSLAAALYSLGGIDSATVLLTIQNLTDGTILLETDLGDPRFSWTRTPAPHFGVMDSFFFNPEPGFWPDGKQIMCSIYGYVHHIDHTGYETYSWYFYTDFSPPYLQALIPDHGETVLFPQDTMYFNFGDETAGVLETAISCSLFYNGNPYRIPFSALIRIVGDTLALPITNYGIDISGCDSVRFCAHAIDAVSAQFCGPNVMDECISFTTDCTVPTAELLTPVSGLALSCTLQNIVFLLQEDVNLDSNSINLIINNDTISMDDVRFSISPSGTLTFTPDVSWSDGDTVTGYLNSLCDMLGNCNEITPFNFIVDISPPIIDPIYPLPGALIADSLVVISIKIKDEITSLSGFGIWGDLTGTFTYFSDSLFIYDPTGTGTIFGPEDTIHIGVWAADSPETCAVNFDTLEYYFVVDAIGPRITEIDSVIGNYTSCDDRCILFHFEDFTGLDLFSVKVYSSHESETLTFLSPQLEISPDSIAYCPSFSYADGETVRIVVISGKDIAGNEFSADSIVETFIVDLSTPRIETISLSPGETLATTAPNIFFTVFDSIAGIYQELCTLWVYSPDIDTILIYGDSGIDFYDDTVAVSFFDTDIRFRGGDSVQICIRIADWITDSLWGCDNHWADTCTYFYIDASPPIVAPARPGDGAITSCIEQTVDFVIADTEGVDWDTVVIVINGEVYSISSPELEHIGVSDTARYTPAIPYEDDTVQVCVIYARDTIGNELEDSVCWYFYIDTIPPVVIQEYPYDGTYIGNPTPTIWATMDDTITGYVIVDSILLGGIWYPTDGSVTDSFFYEIVDSLSEGANIVCIAMRDQPDFCPPNDTISCWQFFLDISSPILQIDPENLIISSCDSMQFFFAGYDIDSVILVDITSNGTFDYSVDTPSDTSLLGEGFVFAPSENETLYVHITLSDSFGNIVTDSISFAFDLSPPEITFLSPPDGDTLFEQSPIMSVLTEDESGVRPDSAIFIIHNDFSNDTFYYSVGEIEYADNVFEISLQDLGYILPERGFSTVIFDDVFDSVSGNYDCPIRYSIPESITIFIQDDDTIPPDIDIGEIDSAWCGGTFIPRWEIYDTFSGVDSTWVYISEMPDFVITDTLTLYESSANIWEPETSLYFASDTMWFIVCAVDSDNDFGYGFDTSQACSDTMFLVCRKPYIEILNDTLHFGEICMVDSSRILEFGIYNPTGVDIVINFEQYGDTAFIFDEDTVIIPAGEIGYFPVEFMPILEQMYSGQILVNIGYAEEIVYLLGEGILCPLGFSAEPRVITPNDDGYYDFVLFTFPLRGNNKVEIFAKHFSRVRVIQSDELRLIWNGLDDKGTLCPPGAYIFIAFEDGQIIEKGIIILAR
ncbi:hypothetical protein DRQ33_02320, partial [bacterium]